MNHEHGGVSHVGSQVCFCAPGFEIDDVGKPFELERNDGGIAVLGWCGGPWEPDAALKSWLCPRCLNAIMDFIGLEVNG